MMFKIGMFDLDKVEIYSNEFNYTNNHIKPLSNEIKDHNSWDKNLNNFEIYCNI